VRGSSDPGDAGPDEAHRGVGKVPGQPGQVVGGHLHVRVDEGDVRRRDGRQSGVAGTCRADVDGQLNQICAVPARGLGDPLGNERGVVDDDATQGSQRGECPVQLLGSIANGDDHCEVGLGDGWEVA